MQNPALNSSTLQREYSIASPEPTLSTIVEANAGQ